MGQKFASMREQSRVPACFLAGPRGCGLERGCAGRVLLATDILVMGWKAVLQRSQL